MFVVKRDSLISAAAGFSPIVLGASAFGLIDAVVGTDRPISTNDKHPQSHREHHHIFGQ
ncbi:hypothetical protein EV664_10262 [Stakelama pacifica]|uniref:Uncharacterized protein n=1 Tax=Stakelama pacifica TaxID=517720 RepID=A0A4R6FUG4_9SPHN|nr:hypothetical protein EV664_10262 [Stakelama pacifica]